MESLLQDGVKFHVQMLLELSWCMLAELEAPHRTQGGAAEKIYMPEDPVYTNLMRQHACLHTMNMVEWLALNTNLMLLVHIV